MHEGPEAGMGLASLPYLDHQVWLELESEVEVEVGAEGREVTG